jgi:hypothetical protein
MRAQPKGSDVIRTTRHTLALVFAGHMVDLPDRPHPRFPPELEPAAAAAIAAAIDRRLGRLAPADVVAISSLARGGDILFQEHARARMLLPRVILPFAPEIFLDRSVRGVATGSWEERFWWLWRETAPDHREVLSVARGDNPYEACNRRQIDLACRLSQNVVLIALSDGSTDGAGGTHDFIRRGRAAGGHVELIDLNSLPA